MLFRDFVTNLSLKRPGAKNKLSYYIRRLGKETATRRLAAALIVIVTLFQAFTFIVPPKPSNAASPNDIHYGGYSNKDQVIAEYQNNAEIRAIYQYFGIRLEDLQNAGYEVKGLWGGEPEINSIGRNPHSAQDQLLSIPGASTTIYLRPLASWGANANYTVLHGANAWGQEFFVMMDCGNIAVRGLPRPLPTPTPTPVPTPKPKFDCLGLSALPSNGTAPLTVNYVGQGSATGTTITNYIFDFGDGSPVVDQTSNKVSHTYSKAGDYIAKLKVKSSLGVSVDNKACQQPIKVTPVLTPNLDYLKTADNLTVLTADNKPTDANNTTVAAGNKIRYNLLAHNSGDGVAKGFVFEENISDILEYADVIDMGGATSSIKEKQTILTWPAVDVAAGKNEVKSFIVQVKNPIPTTATSVSDPTSFDLKMDNVFKAHPVSIKLPPPPAKRVEQAAEKLPQTGSSLPNLILAIFSSGAVFVFLRARLLKHELEIISTLPSEEL